MKLRLKLLLFSLLGMIVLSSFIWMDQNEKNRGNSPVKVIQQDGFKVPVYDFKSFKNLLKKNNDTTYILNFWATWCKPCVAEMPHFESFAKSQKGKKVKLIFVSLDFPSQYEKNLIPFLKRKNIISECVVLDEPDANAWIPQVDAKWSGAIPATVIYKNGSRFFHEGSMTEAELQLQTQKILNK